MLFSGNVKHQAADEEIKYLHHDHLKPYTPNVYLHFPGHFVTHEFIKWLTDRLYHILEYQF